MTTKNQEFAANLASVLGITNSAEIATLAGYIDAWNGGFLSPTQFAQKISEFVTLQTGRDMDLSDWALGTIDGGPAGDGIYPVRIQGGGTVNLPSPAKLTAVTAKGDPGGVIFTFSTTTADADPGSGKFRLNNATASAVTSLYFDNNEASGVVASAWLDTFDDVAGSFRGYLHLRDVLSDKFIVYKVTGSVVDGTGYRKVPVSHLVGDGGFTNNARIAVVFIPKGDKGASLLNGTGAPSNSLGLEGDIYLNLASGDFYGPKGATTWGSPITATGLNAILADAVAAKNAAIDAASAAGGFASSAAGSATTANSSRDAAVAAKTSAETARDTSIAAKDTSVTKAGEASTSAGAAETARIAAVVAKSGSEDARDASVTAKDAAVAAKTSAETARDASIAAKDTSVAAKTSAETARDASIAAKDTSVTKAGEASASATTAGAAKDAAVAAKTSAETARDASIAAKDTSVTKAGEASASSTAAATAKTAAEAAQAGAEAARDAAVAVAGGSFVPLSQKGAAGGVATLDSGGKVPLSQLDTDTLGGLKYMGTWNASTNSPAIPAAASGNKGQYYKVATAGTTSINTIADWGVGDWIVSNGSVWDKIDNSEQVSSVAGKSGAVTLVKGDVGLGNVDNTSDANKPVSTAQQTALDGKQDVMTKATSGDATTGTDDTKYMTPLQTKNAIAALASSEDAEALAWFMGA